MARLVEFLLEMHSDADTDEPFLRLIHATCDGIVYESPIAAADVFDVSIQHLTMQADRHVCPGPQTSAV